MSSNVYVVAKEQLTSIANAIRTKGETTEQLVFPDGYVSAIETMETGGGLNLEVVGGTTQPTNPKENTIWVNTNITINEWTIKDIEPTNPNHGDIWVSLVSVSDIVIDILDENNIILKIGDIKQYKTNKWEVLEAQIYKDEGWKLFDPSFYLIKKGKFVYTPSCTSGATFEEKEDYVLFQGSGGGYWCGWFGSVSINGNKHKTLNVQGTFTVVINTDVYYKLAIWDINNTPSKNNMLASANLINGENTISIDVSGFNGVYNVGVLSTFTQEQKITALYLAE